MFEKNYWGITNPEVCDGATVVKLDIEKALRELVMYMVESRNTKENYTIKEKISNNIAIKLYYEYHRRNNGNYESCSKFMVWVKIRDKKIISFSGNRYIFADDDENNPYYKFDFSKHSITADFVFSFMRNIDDIISYTNKIEEEYWKKINEE